MIEHFFKPVFYTPLYNALAFLIQHIPYADLGIAVIILTIVVKLIIFPLNVKSIRTQVKMKLIEPELAALKAKYPDRQEQAQQMMLLYRKNNINPFGGILPVLIQLPIIISLYSIFRSSGLPAFDVSMLYSFVHLPTAVNVNFLGLFSVIGKNLWLAIIVAITQIIQVHFSIPKVKKPEGAPTFKDDLARSMNLQMRFILPLLTAYISYITSGAVALYLITSNLFAIGQEVYVRKHIRKN
jgi:YidC/Oxa1 family membrane protein insertase